MFKDLALSSFKFLHLQHITDDTRHPYVQPLNYVPFFNRVSGTGGLMFRAWWGRM